ncbi:MAG: hypothetical protein AAGF12_30190 [Myxococcota bacterium]
MTTSSRREQPRGCCRRQGGQLLGSGVAGGATVLAFLVPKCPLCIVGYAALFGLGTSAAAWVPYLRPGALGLALMAVLAVSLSSLRRPRP